MYWEGKEGSEMEAHQGSSAGTGKGKNGGSDGGVDGSLQGPWDMRSGGSEIRVRSEDDLGVGKK